METRLQECNFFFSEVLIYPNIVSTWRSHWQSSLTKYKTSKAILMKGRHAFTTCFAIPQACVFSPNIIAESMYVSWSRKRKKDEGPLFHLGRWWAWAADMDHLRHQNSSVGRPCIRQSSGLKTGTGMKAVWVTNELTGCTTAKWSGIWVECLNGIVTAGSLMLALAQWVCES